MPLSVDVGHSSLTGPRERNEDFCGMVTPQGAELENKGLDVYKRQVFRTSGNEVFALRDHCPHKGGPLSQGLVHGNQVTCPLHGWKLRLDSGEAVAPDEGCARRYPIRVDSGTVFLQI